jgi:hypothetical protein
MYPRFERQPDFLGRLNQAMESSGRQFDCVLACPREGINFSRKNASAAVLDHSYGSVAAELRASGSAVPRRFGNAQPLVSLYADFGYTGDNTNPNPVGVGLGTPPRPNPVALGIPVADAQATVLVHAPSGALCAMSGIRPELPNGSVAATMQALRDIVVDLGYKFDSDDVWAIMSPGARADTYLVDAKAYRLFAEASERFVRNDHFVGLDSPVEVPTPDGRVRTMIYGLDLGVLIRDEWIYQGVHPGQIYFDPRNNMTYEEGGRLVLPSKRLAEATGQSSYDSGLFAAVVRVL